MTHRTLLLMRHAKSDWSHAGLHDHDRPLNSRGRNAAPAMAKYIHQSKIAVDSILASTARRVQETVELMQTGWSGEFPNVVSTRNLYLATASMIESHVAEMDDRVMNLMVVGHNPGIEELASRLANTQIVFPTACLAVFAIDTPGWQNAARSSTWTLQQVCRPKDLQG